MTGRSRPLIVGHRGARNIWPENSLDGFLRTLALGVDGVEFDVHRSADGKLVVIHDPTLDRTTEATGAVSERTAQQLAATRLRDAGGEGVPSLSAVLELLASRPVELHIEVKTDVNGNAYPGLERELLAEIAAHGLGDRAIVTSFVPGILEQVRRQKPDQRVLASLDRRSAEMLGGIDRALQRFDAITGCLLAVEKSLLSHCLPQCLQRFGQERLGVWILNEPDEFAAWRDVPLRQVTTDRPDNGLKCS